MKILVTGGSGLVGTAIYKLRKIYLKYEFIFISSKECDLKDYNKTLSIFKKYNQIMYYI